MRTLIQNGQLIDPSQNINEIKDLFLEDDRIVGIGQPPESFQADRVVDATGLWVIPGLVDLSVSLREPGFTQKGTIASETYAAAAGGVTTLLCPPDTSPIIDTPAVASLVQDKANEAGRVNVLPTGALTQGLKGSALSNMMALADSGCVAFTNHRHAMASTKVLSRALEYAASHDLLVIFHADEHELSNDGCAHEGLMSTMHGLIGIPETAETIALARDLILVERTGVMAHFARISCAKSVEMLADAQAQGLKVTADVALHNLLLTDDVLGSFDGHYHVRPPLRSDEDRLTLIEGVKSGVISAICSDHQPHDKMAKLAPFAATEPGMANVEVLLSQALLLVDEGDIELSRLLQCLTQGPAECLRLEAGTLKVGNKADFVLFDSTKKWVLNDETKKTKGMNSPWMNESFSGKVTATYLAGQEVFTD